MSKVDSDSYLPKKQPILYLQETAFCGEINNKCDLS